MAKKSQSGNTLENNMKSTSETSNKMYKGETKEQSLDQLFEKVLKDAHSCEKQLVEALDELSKEAYAEELQDAFKEHKEQTQRHVERIEKICDRLRIEDVDSETCKVVETMVEVTKDIINEYDKGPVRDSALIIAAQKVEHFEIALYGSLCELADVLGHHKVIDILERTLDEEKMTDNHLSDIARDVNDEAFEMSQELQES
jgi:ferritin-like metal-binding protein YciE